MTARTPGDVFDDIFGSSTARTPGDVLNDLFGPAATARDDVVVMTGNAVTAVTRVGDVQVSAMTVAMMKASDVAMLQGMQRHRSRSPSSSNPGLKSSSDDIDGDARMTLTGVRRVIPDSDESSSVTIDDLVERWETLAGRKMERYSLPSNSEQAVDPARRRRRRRRLAPVGGSTTLEQPVESARKRRRRSQHAPRDSEATSGDATMTDACACEAIIVP